MSNEIVWIAFRSYFTEKELAISSTVVVPSNFPILFLFLNRKMAGTDWNGSKLFTTSGGEA
jgi:hypothetical protein